MSISTNSGKRISIIGCGWLGLPLATFLLAKGYTVKGSTTRAEKLPLLKAEGIHPFRIQLDPAGLIGEHIDDFLNTDILIINIPPGRRRADVETIHPQEIQALVAKALAHKVQRILFISSTGVFANLNRIITEEDIPEPNTESGKALVTIEHHLQSLELPTTILRMSGLVGGDRKAGRFLAGKKDVANGAAAVNMVHREDCIRVIYEVIRQACWGELFHISADEHPTREAFYTAQAEEQGFEPPLFKQNDTPSYKIISNEKVKRELGFAFLHRDPMKFI